MEAGRVVGKIEHPRFKRCLHTMQGHQCIAIVANGYIGSNQRCQHRMVIQAMVIGFGGLAQVAVQCGCWHLASASSV